MLELTETAFLDHKDVALTNLQRLQDLGYKIALDDFGSGYSSINNLLEFPVNTIKFDSSFIARIVDSTKCQEIFHSFIGLARKLKLELVAEGVEHLDQVHRLKELGCTLVQGYYFSKPLPKAQAATFLEKTNSIIQGA